MSAALRGILTESTMQTSKTSRLRKLHDDEAGPNTVEWVLLIIVALLVLTGIYYFVNRSKNELNQAANQENQALQTANDNLNNQNSGSGNQSSDIGGN